jgi:ATP-dependent helicase/nuclease subunit A
MKREDSRIQKPDDDREQRRRAVEETNRSFIVEASAGTGKTRTLIDRIIRLVLEKGPAGPPLRLSEICAITFTEKAAGELKVRLRQHFEQTLKNQQTSSGNLLRAREALIDLETAAISTFHSFAVSLLKERPVEAALDPRFTALNEIRSELYFRDVWEPWIGRALENRNPILERALRNGIRLESLENLARILRLKWLIVRNLDSDSPPPEEQCRQKIQDLLLQGKNLLALAIKVEDKLVAFLERALNWLEHPDREADALAKPGGAGATANWTGAKDTVRVVREFVKETVEFQTAFQNLPAQQFLDDVVRWIKEAFMKEEWEKRKQAEGLLDFDDQLYLARDLLLKHKTVRREFQERYKALLVDEFQDTDPIQWEMVLMLSSEDFDEADISRLRPAPGRLFIVGDPKQSIYRFRNADIETYLDVVKNREALGLNLLELTTNFRSVPSILGFVDSAFRDAMKAPDEDGYYQPDYLAFGDHGFRNTELQPPAVHLLGDISSEDDSKRTTRKLIERESRRIAKLIRSIHGSKSWKVEREKDNWVVPQYGDIAILLPVLSYAYILEESLRDMEIPYVLEGGKFYYARSEVSSAITVLRSIANPNDSVALYGSLRSIFFGLSDEDLLQAHVEGQVFDYRKPVPSESPLHHAYEILLDLHRHRHQKRPSETFEILLQKTCAREVLAVRGFQSLANLNKLGRTLRALQDKGTFSQIVDLLATMDEEKLAESESRLMEERSDAVRIMSIHKAKGLDFPIVFAAALGLKRKTPARNLLADSRDRKIFALNIGSKDSGLQSARWDELIDEEKKRENAELLRLLYVGLTRARDHMILSTHTAAWKQTDDAERWVPDTAGTRLGPLSSFLEDCFSGSNKFMRIIDVDALDAAPDPERAFSAPTMKDWRSIADREFKALDVLIHNTPSAGKLQMAGQAGEASLHEDSAPEDRMPEAAENRFVRLGIAFHEAMERVDLFSQKDHTRFTQELTARHRLDRDSALKLEDMMRISLSSDLLERARAAASSGRRVLREIPFVRSLNQGTIEEGKIDLLFEEENGWALVDYKTDWVSKDAGSVEEFFRNKYSSQIGEYLGAMQVLSVNVTSAYLLLARTGTAIKLL